MSMPVLLADGPLFTSMESTMPFFPSRKLLDVPGSRRFDLLGWKEERLAVQASNGIQGEIQ
ncbi:hypothetical protein H5410_028064 [Solanum commersonii]|uniref:Uncharacterized protein n=1 Tax=Solanum commersonii TaxID=4109 RepID=A0A9J5Z560_SOLCO|nr:hypothetical protein H5410_028064 [Solanum commersonii]